MSDPLERQAGGARPAVKVLLVVIALPLLALPILLRAFLIEAFQTPSSAMSPTLLMGDHFFVNKTVGHPDAGDVIVFQYPLDPETSYIKRVIGLPGDTVAIVHNELQINGKPVPRRDLGEQEALEGKAHAWEERLGHHTYTIHHRPGRETDFGPVHVPADSYFVMGDNRDNSNDSRVWGTVASKFVQGRALFVWYSAAPDGPVRWSRIGHRVE